MKTGGIILVSIALSTMQLSAQVYSTRGADGPILVGARNKVNYIKRIETRNNIPTVLAPYIAGLIFSNKGIKSDTASINSAVVVWMNKYQELKAKIGLLPDTTNKNICMRLLDQGEFPSVERTLNISTNFRDLKRTFPETYQTNGSQSPIIVGDFGSVTYIVTQIIQYNLPEDLTVNLLAELKLSRDTVLLKSRQVGQLNRSIESKESTIRNWIARYRSVAIELKTSPGIVNRQAYALFIKGDFNGALKALRSGTSSEKALANNNLLKAKILLLQLNFKAFDSTLAEINNAYNVSVSLSPSYSSLLEYGQFLIDYMNGGTLAVPLLTRALDSAVSLKQKIIVYRLLSNAWMVTDKVRSNQIIDQALTLLKEKEPLTDSTLLVNKALMQYYMGLNYSEQLFDTVNYRRAVNMVLAANQTLIKIHPQSADIRFKQALFDRAIGFGYIILRDTSQAVSFLQKALDFFEAPENANLLYIAAHVRTYLNLAQVYINAVQLAKANVILFKTIKLIGDNVNLKSKVYVDETLDIYTLLIRNFLAMNKKDSALKYSIEFKEMITPYAGSASDIYTLPLADVNADLGVYYLEKREFSKSKEAFDQSFNFFIKNLTVAVANKPKFEECIYYFNQYYVTLKKIDSGILFNKNLLKVILDNQGFNSLAFGDLEMQIYFHLFDLFTTDNKMDSGELYIRKALFTSEIKSRQGPIKNIEYYAYYGGRYATLLMRTSQLQKLDSLSDAYFTSCQYMSNFSAYIQEHYQGVIGNCFGAYAVSIGDEMDSTPVNPVKDLRRIQKYLKIQDRFFTEGEKHFEVAARETDNGTQFALGYFLYQWALSENRWVSISEENELTVHRNKKNDLLKQSLSIVNRLPPTAASEDLKNHILMILN